MEIKDMENNIYHVTVLDVSLDWDDSYILELKFNDGPLKVGRIEQVKFYLSERQWIGGKMLEKLMNEMFTPCHVCQGCGINIEEQKGGD